MIIYLSRLVRCQAWEGGYNPYSDCFKCEQGDEMEAVAAAEGGGVRGVCPLEPGMQCWRLFQTLFLREQTKREDDHRRYGAKTRRGGGDCNVTSVCCPWYASPTSPSLSVILSSLDPASVDGRGIAQGGGRWRLVGKRTIRRHFKGGEVGELVTRESR